MCAQFLIRAGLSILLYPFYVPTIGASLNTLFLMDSMYRSQDFLVALSIFTCNYSYVSVPAMLCGFYFTKFCFNIQLYEVRNYGIYRFCVLYRYA